MRRSRKREPLATPSLSCNQPRLHNGLGHASFSSGGTKPRLILLRHPITHSQLHKTLPAHPFYFHSINFIHHLCRLRSRDHKIETSLLILPSKHIEFRDTPAISCNIGAPYKQLCNKCSLAASLQGKGGPCLLAWR